MASSRARENNFFFERESDFIRVEILIFILIYFFLHFSFKQSDFGR